MELKVGYKQTEVGVIPEDWNVYSLDEMTDSKRPISYGIVQTGPGIQNGIRCLRVVDIDDGRIRKDDLITTSQEISNAYKRTILKKDDLVMPLRGKVGETAIVDEEIEGSNLTRGVALISIRRCFDSYYCKYYISSDATRTRLAQVMNGSALQEIPIAPLRAFKIAVPVFLEEQQAIATALSDADALIEALEQLLAKKRQIKQGAMQELLTGQRRLPGFAGEWETKALGALASVQRGASPRPIDCPIWFDENSSVGWVRISDVTQAGLFLRETTQRLSAEGIRHSRPVASGSLIMSICATVGRPVITKLDTCIHDGFVVFDQLAVDQMYLYYTLRFIEQDWSRHGQTGSQMNLNTGLINSTHVSVPPTQEEQTAIATVLSDMDADIATLEAKLAKARSVKQGMMQELLTGRIRLV
ncbi:MAG: restriction endonuclease subunit S [Formivibrio sp.]|nr:restriction endonuclease subunit S [Formivibrio sp.]